METEISSEGYSSDVHQQGSCSAQKGSCMCFSQKGTKKRKVGSNDATKHAMGYKTKWETDFPWLLPEKNSTGVVTGMLCQLCRRHKTVNKYIVANCPETGGTVPKYRPCPAIVRI